jgi:VWFA-related protein
MKSEKPGRILVLLVAFSCFATSRAESQTQPAPSPFGETVEVRRATIDVVVTAKNGEHVKKLGVGDFELVVDGKPQQIMGFEEVDIRRAADVPAAAAVVPPAATPSRSADVALRRNIILLLDLYSLDGQRRNQAIESLRRFLTSGWSAGDQVMVAVWNRELHVPLTFTNDLAAVERQLDEVKKLSEGGLGKDRRIVELRIRFEIQKAQMASGSASAREIQAAYDNSIMSAGFYAEEQSKRAKNFATDVEELMRGVAGVSGKKVLVLVGENFPQFPGLGVFEYVNELFNPYSRLLKMRNAQFLASSRSLSHLVPKLTRAANAHGIAVHTIFSGETPSETPAEQEHPTATMAQFAEFTNTAGSFGTLSRDTGGVATLGSRNFDLATARIAGDLGHYYTLVWRIESAGKKSQSVEVRTRDRSLVVRARRSLVPKTLDDEIEDAVVARLYQQHTPGSPEVRVQVGKPIAAGRTRTKIPVEVSFPSSLLTLIAQDSRRVGGFEVIVAASDGKNRLSETSRKVTEVAWEPNAIPETVLYDTEVVVRAGDGGSLAVAVVDRLGKATWYQTVAIPKR